MHAEHTERAELLRQLTCGQGAALEPLADVGPQPIVAERAHRVAEQPVLRGQVVVEVEQIEPVQSIAHARPRFAAGAHETPRALCPFIRSLRSLMRVLASLRARTRLHAPYAYSFARYARSCASSLRCGRARDSTRPMPIHSLATLAHDPQVSLAACRSLPSRSGSTRSTRPATSGSSTGRTSPRTSMPRCER